MGKCEYHRTQLGLGLKQSSLGGTFYPNVSKNHKIHSASLSTGEDRVVLAFGEIDMGVENNTTRSCICSPTCMPGAAFSIVCSSRVCSTVRHRIFFNGF